MYLEAALCQAGASLVKAVKEKVPGEANIPKKPRQLNSLWPELLLGQSQP